MSRLSNKSALITGGTSGIGLETALQFVSEGARVAVTGKNPKSLEAAKSVLGNDVLVIESDAGDVLAQRMVAEQVRQTFGNLDILFVNAGVAEFGPLETWDETSVDRSIAINFKGPFFLVQALLPIFSNPASIILMTSINSRIGAPNSSIYASTKAALLSLARTLSGELIGRNIRVNAVSAGPIATPLYAKLGMSDADTAMMAQSKVPARRFGTPSEIAKVIVYFASDESAYTIGSELVIDGGMSNL